MIIVEGPDGSGKTTLIDELRELTELEVAPRVVSKDAEAMVDLVKWTEDNIRAGWQSKIFDRHRLISEPIYGPILREEPQPGFRDVDWFYPMLRQFYDLEPIIIYCLPPFKQVWNNIRRDPDNQVVSDPAISRAIYGAYVNKAITDHALYRHSWVYDYTDSRFSHHLVSLIVKNIEKKVQS